MHQPTLQWHERLYHRDQLRNGRYAALADAEGFHTICFALEALGMRLLGRKDNLGQYETPLTQLACEALAFTHLPENFPQSFSSFVALFRLVRNARNDAMHTGVYARHATTAAIDLCIGLEEALMKQQQVPRQYVKDFMVKSPVTVEPWQPVALARQLMLTHSFSFLPVQIQDKWRLISESALAKHLRSGGNPKELFAQTIEAASHAGLTLIDASVVQLNTEINELIDEAGPEGTRLWLVKDNGGNLCGVLSPFELM